MELSHVKGSEAGGRITAEDVKAYVRERSRRVGAPPNKGGQDKGGTVFSTTYGSERREAIVMSFPEAMRKDFRDWSGVKDFRAYNRLKSGEWIYRVTRSHR